MQEVGEKRGIVEKEEDEEPSEEEKELVCGSNMRLG